MSLPPANRLGGAERRRAPRAPADLSFQLAAAGLPAAKDGGAARLRDISTLGLSCVSPSAVPEMTRVRVALDLPATSGKQNRVEAEGAVVRCEPTAHTANRGGADGFEVAVFFTKIDPAARDSIHGYVTARLTR